MFHRSVSHAVATPAFGLPRGAATVTTGGRRAVATVAPILPRAAAILASALALIAAGCGDAPRTGIAADWTAEREERGDTVIVRTVEGSVWGDTMVLVPRVAIGVIDGADAYILGNPIAADLDAAGRILVADQQARVVRVYDPEGTHRATLGRGGEGPGEFTAPDDLRIGPGGEVIVRDQQGARFSVFSPSGEFLRSWPLIGGFRTSTPFHVTADGQVLHPTLRNPGVPLDEWQMGIVVFAPDGTALDTLDVPSSGYEAPFVEARAEGSWSRSAVPFTPREHWVATPEGDLVHGVSTEYRLDRRSANGRVLRMARDAERAPVRSAEAAAARDGATRNMRNVDPAWRWRGEEVPASKPPYSALVSGSDGSLWVRRHVEAHEEENPAWDPDRPDGPPRTRWVEPVVFDVFDAEGRYMGPVLFPDGALVSRRGRFTLESVLAVVTHEYGHEQVVLHDLVPASQSRDGDG